MKPVAFDYVQPESLGAAVRVLAEKPDAKLIAGGQTLGPMLNLRLVQPALLVDITRIPELTRIEDGADSLLLGACITHAAIEDRRIPDCTGGLLGEVARGIAYRAVRTRGTIGGSLAHADPAADWVTCLILLRAEVLVSGPAGQRRELVSAFVRGALTTSLAPGEIIDGIRIPKAARQRCGYAKLARKTGEFAEAIGAVAIDHERRTVRIVAGAGPGRPIVIDKQGIDPAILQQQAVMAEWLAAAGLEGDAYARHLQVAAVVRAAERAMHA